MRLSPLRANGLARYCTQRSGADSESVDLGPMDVKVIGSVAIVQGSDTEKSSTKGKDISGGLYFGPTMRQPGTGRLTWPLASGAGQSRITNPGICERTRCIRGIGTE